MRIIKEIRWKPLEGIIGNNRTEIVEEYVKEY